MAVKAVEDDADFWADLPSDFYHTEAPDGAIVIGEQRPTTPVGFRAEGGDGRVTGRWGLNGEPGEKALLWTAMGSPQFSEAVLTYTGDADGFVQVIPNLKQPVRVYGWVASSVDGALSVRSPEDDVSSVSAVARVPSVTHRVSVPPGGCPEPSKIDTDPADLREQAARVTYNDGDTVVADDDRLWRARSPARSPFDPAVGVANQIGRSPWHLHAGQVRHGGTSIVSALR